MSDDDRKPISVMIVDDEQELVDFLAKRLRKRGFEVETALSGDVALERLESDHDEVGSRDRRPEVPTCVLVVDDEEELLQYLGKRLRLRGFEVETALSGEAAMKRLEDQADVDVVVLDMKMVGMTGLETLKSIKARHPQVEVIMLTGHASVQGAMDALQTGAMDYLTKPCDINVLVNKVGVAKSRKDGRGSDEAAKR